MSPSCVPRPLYVANNSADILRLAGTRWNRDLPRKTYHVTSSGCYSNAEEMAFFNLAHLGPQDSIQAKLKATNPVEPNERKEDTNTTDVLHRKQQVHVASSDELPSTSQTVSAHCTVESSPPTNDVSATQSSAKKAPWHKGSHVKYTDMLRKHQRNPEGAAAITNLINLAHSLITGVSCTSCGLITTL